MPWHDWQFWLVTLIAAASAWHVLRQLLPRRREDSGAACGGCATGSAACAKTAAEKAQRLVTLGR